VSDAGDDDNGKCVDQMRDRQLINKDFAACSLIGNAFDENTVGWTDNQAYNRQEHIWNCCAENS
jgi:hypothetical protein